MCCCCCGALCACVLLILSQACIQGVLGKEGWGCNPWWWRPGTLLHTETLLALLPCCHRRCLLPAVTPPGHYTAGGVTSICPDGSFRADWLPPAQAAACTPCGSGVQGDKSDRVTVYNLTTGAATRLPVMTTGGDCCEFCFWHATAAVVCVHTLGTGGCQLT